MADTGLSCLNCGKAASLSNTCPVCKKLGIRTSVFCSSECFKTNWAAHKRKYHDPAVEKTDAGAKVEEPPTEGVWDPFTGRPRFSYTGALRASYQRPEVPKREVPESIARPEYATNAKGESFGEKVASRLGSPKELGPKEIEGMRKVCRLAREVLDIAAAAIKPGVTTLEIDEIVHNECLKRDSYPSPLGYHHFPRSVCTSVNEVICHGIPDARPLRDGDIVNLDVTLFHNGFHGDLNATYCVGDSVSEEHKALIKAARRSLDNAIRLCKPGFLFRDLGHVIEKTAKEAGFSVNHTYTGHGINQLFHCPPNVPHYADNRAKGTMKPGMTFTIEPMLCAGHFKETHWPDNWTAVTEDGKYSAQFEETLLVTKDGIEVLTAAPGWKLPPKDA